TFLVHLPRSANLLDENRGGMVLARQLGAPELLDKNLLRGPFVESQPTKGHTGSDPGAAERVNQMDATKSKSNSSSQKRLGKRNARLNHSSAPPTPTTPLTSRLHYGQVPIPLFVLRDPTGRVSETVLLTKDPGSDR